MDVSKRSSLPDRGVEAAQERSPYDGPQPEITSVTTSTDWPKHGVHGGFARRGHQAIEVVTSDSHAITKLDLPGKGSTKPVERETLRESWDHIRFGRSDGGEVSLVSLHVDGVDESEILRHCDRLLREASMSDDTHWADAAMGAFARLADGDPPGGVGDCTFAYDEGFDRIVAESAAAWLTSLGSGREFLRYAVGISIAACLASVCGVPHPAARLLGRWIGDALVSRRDTSTSDSAFILGTALRVARAVST